MWCRGVISVICGLSGKHTYTHASTGVQKESGFTDAFEAAIFIDAQSVKAHIPDKTLILVCGSTERNWLIDNSTFNDKVVKVTNWRFYIFLHPSLVCSRTIKHWKIKCSRARALHWQAKYAVSKSSPEGKHSANVGTRIFSTKNVALEQPTL